MKTKQAAKHKIEARDYIVRERPVLTLAYGNNPAPFGRPKLTEFEKWCCDRATD